MCIGIEFEFIDPEHFSRMGIRICYKAISCEKREVRASNSKSMVLRIVHVFNVPQKGGMQKGGMQKEVGQFFQNGHFLATILSCNGQIVGQPMQERGNVDKMSENAEKMSKIVRKLSRGAENTISGHFSDNFGAFFRHFCFVTLSNARPLQILSFLVTFLPIPFCLPPFAAG